MVFHKLRRLFFDILGTFFYMLRALFYKLIGMLLCAHQPMIDLTAGFQAFLCRFDYQQSGEDILLNITPVKDAHLPRDHIFICLAERFVQFETIYRNPADIQPEDHPCNDRRDHTLLIRDHKEQMCNQWLQKTGCHPDGNAEKASCYHTDASVQIQRIITVVPKTFSENQFHQDTGDQFKQ